MRDWNATLPWKQCLISTDLGFLLKYLHAGRYSGVTHKPPLLLQLLSDPGAPQSPGVTK